MTSNTPAPRPSAEEVDALLSADTVGMDEAHLRRWTRSAKKALTSLVEENAALTRAVEERDEALRPFAAFSRANTATGEGGDAIWLSNAHRERISYWFGPSDFRRAASLSDMGGA